MPWEAWLTLATVVMLIIGLARAWAAPDLLVIACLTALVAIGQVTGSTLLPNPAAAVAGFGNAGAVTVGVLFVVVAGLVHTGAMGMLTQKLLGRPRTVVQAQIRLLMPVAGLSAFLNNTPIVAMFMPVVDDLCRKLGISPSRLFLPLSYAAIFGGVCTLIGTSTNLVVNGLVIQAGLPPLGMFEPAWIGVPCAVVGMVYIVLFSRRLLPDRRPPISLSDDPRQYTAEMIVQAAGPMVGQTIEQAGLRHLPGLFLAEIERQGHVLAAVSPQMVLQGDDRLVFVGVVESVVDLQKLRGLAPATDQVFKLDAPRVRRCLVEAVVSDRCPLVGRTIRDGRFRSVYNAAVLAVARGGERISGKIGDIVLRAGDTLMLETHQSFAHQQRNSNDFYLVSHIENSAPARHERAWVAVAIMVAMIASVTFGLLDMLTAALLAGGLMLVTRCCTGAEARRSVDWSVLLVIGGALGIGHAVQSTGVARVIASAIIDIAGGNPWLVLAAIYLVTVIFTEVITNNAAAVLVFPIALASAVTLNVDPKPFILSVMVAASASFATPIGYQTNLMVFGPGGYRFSDYLRFGIPMDLLFMAVTVALAPLIWPF